MDLFFDLPVELIQEILSFLSFQEIMRLLTVCKFFYDFRTLIPEIDFSLPFFRHNPIFSSRLKSRGSSFLRDFLAQFTRLVSLSFRDASDFPRDFFLNDLPHSLSSLLSSVQAIDMSACTAVSAVAIPGIVSKFKNLRVIKLKSIPASEHVLLELLAVSPNLTELDISSK